MAESKSKKITDEKIAARYEQMEERTERLDRLCDFLDGTPDPLEAADREDLVSREEWESLEDRERKKAVGFIRGSSVLDRHQLHPATTYARTDRTPVLDRTHRKALKTPKIYFRFKDGPFAALGGERTIGVAPLVTLVPRMKTTPTEDLPVMLNTRLFDLVYRHYHGPWKGEDVTPVQDRLEGFEIPMLTKRTGGAFREARDEILKLAEKNSDRLARMDQVHQIAEEGGVRLVPLRRSEGIIREINVPKPLGEVADVKRRGPVVIFRRGSTIVTTTEEAATYLALWLKQRFDKLRGMAREELEEYIKIPALTSHVVVVLQLRAQIEAEIDETQDRIDELQDEAEDALYDLYGLTEAEREYLRSEY